MPTSLIRSDCLPQHLGIQRRQSGRLTCPSQLPPIQRPVTAQDVDYAARAHLSLLIRTRA